MSNYSTLTNTREEAGFTGNANISNARIQTFMDAATNYINDAIGKVYSLPLSSTPAILELIERKMAAGHLLWEEYGEQAEGTSKDGKAKVAWAEGTLKSIVDGAIELRDTSSVLLSKNTAMGLKGFPTGSTGTDKTPDGDKDDPPIFEVGMKF